MEFIPVLIVILGIISSIVGSKNNKEKEGGRNIDTSKLDRQQKTAPRKRQPDTGTAKKEEKGFFQTLQEAFDEEFNKTESAGHTQTDQKKSEQQSHRQRDREQSRRPERETIQTSRSRANSSKNLSDFEKKVTDRSEHAKRALDAKESVYTEGYNKRAEKVRGLGKDVAEEVRYSLGEDSSKIQQRNNSQGNGKNITSDDLTFDSKSFVNGIIMSEILGKPKSKQNKEKKLG